MKYAWMGFALLAACTGVYAAGNPVEQARADCAANKIKVRALEARMAPDKEISSARKTWEASCLRAQKVMLTSADAPLASPVLVKPAPTVTLVEPAASAPAGACGTAAPAATPVEEPAMPSATEAPPAS